MREKELRIALICYGGVSLAIYMHGVTKEVWHLARASRAFQDETASLKGVAKIYHELLDDISKSSNLRIRVLPDILSGASAGGINAVFLSQAIFSGQSLEPVTELWLKNADVEELVSLDNRPIPNFFKNLTTPIVWWLFRWLGDLLSENVSEETRREVRRKVSLFVAGKWFDPPFSGARFSKLVFDALKQMENGEEGPPLLPKGHPIDLLVTTTDFHGQIRSLKLNSPPVVKEREHRLPIKFRSVIPEVGGHNLANFLELTFAARATASFPGAFPPLQINEIDQLGLEEGQIWSTRSNFLGRIFNLPRKAGNLEDAALIDGSVLVNAPFRVAIDAIHGRPAKREVDRRFIYIDPTPQNYEGTTSAKVGRITFLEAIANSISALPRNQPISDDLGRIEEFSRDVKKINSIVNELRTDIDKRVQKLFGSTFFLDSPTPERLKNWRRKAQQAAAENAGYAFHSYAQLKFSGIIEGLGLEASNVIGSHSPPELSGKLEEYLKNNGMSQLVDSRKGASTQAIDFFRSYDSGFRIRRFQLLAKSLNEGPSLANKDNIQGAEAARKGINSLIELYRLRKDEVFSDPEFKKRISNVFLEPAQLLIYLKERLALKELDSEAEEILARILGSVPKDLRKSLLMIYLGFPFYDLATLALYRDDNFYQNDIIKVDRISPADVSLLKKAGLAPTLKGTELHGFGGFFSREYREHDYLIGRLQGAERMIEILCSLCPTDVPTGRETKYKEKAFRAIIEEESLAGRCNDELMAEVTNKVSEAPK